MNRKILNKKLKNKITYKFKMIDLNFKILSNAKIYNI